MDNHKGDNSGKIQSMGNSNYFIVRQVELIGVSDYYVKKPNLYPVPMNIYI